MNFAAKRGKLPKRRCITDAVQLHGWNGSHEIGGSYLEITGSYLREYGSDADTIRGLMVGDPPCGADR